MLVVLASAHDVTAQAIVAAWAPWGAALCTPADLSTPGWRHRVGAPEETAAVVGGQVVCGAAIRGVLTRLWAVQLDDLPHIATEDRAYVAAEATAFLVAFLAALPCRVLNRPTAGSLCGPAWQPEQWIRTAFRAGIPVSAIRRSVRPGAWPERPEEPVAAQLLAIDGTVFADPALDAAGEAPAAWARTLAHAASAQLLSLGFVRQGAGFALATVDTMPSLELPAHLDAARDYLLGARQATHP
jgi:hypothetical protein